MKRFLALILWGLVLFFLGGCSTEKAVLRMNLSPVAATKKIYFPSVRDEEVPRYVYIGELIGEQNFVVPDSDKKNYLVEILKFIAGLFENQQPVVLQRPQSGVVDESGRILVTDVSRSAVFVFDENQGALDVWEFAEGYTRFASPSGIALGPEGRVFVADADLARVFLLDKTGKGVGVIGKGALQRPNGLVWDPDTALLYVADTQAHRIKVFDMTGRQVREIGQRGDGVGELNYPTYLALSKQGLVVADTMNARIQVIPLDEGKPFTVGQRGTRYGDFVRPKGVAVDSEDNIYAIESYFDHLLIFDKQGRFLLPIGGTGKDIGSFFLPSGVWVDARNRVYVADTFNGRIMVFQFLGGEAESEN